MDFLLRLRHRGSACEVAEGEVGEAEGGVEVATEQGLVAASEREVVTLEGVEDQRRDQLAQSG